MSNWISRWGRGGIGKGILYLTHLVFLDKVLKVRTPQLLFVFSLLLICIFLNSSFSFFEPHLKLNISNYIYSEKHSLYQIKISIIQTNTFSFVKCCLVIWGYIDWILVNLLTCYTFANRLLTCPKILLNSYPLINSFTRKTVPMCMGQQSLTFLVWLGREQKISTKKTLKFPKGGKWEAGMVRKPCW